MVKKKKKDKEDYRYLLEETIRDKYPLVIVGLVILFLMGGLIFSYFNKKLTNQKKNVISNKKTIEIKEKTPKKSKEKEVVVAKGDSLWKIAEWNYGSGYNWVDIAKINKITRPNLIFRGMRLKIPNVKHRKLTKGKVVKTGTAKVKAKINRYKVRRGDSLSKIALKTYGDMFAWKGIAKVNKIKNPNLIYPNQVLRIP